MNWIIVGGAPLSRETHEFIRVCLGAIVVQVRESYQSLIIEFRSKLYKKVLSIFFETAVILFSGLQLNRKYMLGYCDGELGTHY